MENVTKNVSQDTKTPQTPVVENKANLEPKKTGVVVGCVKLNVRKSPVKQDNILCTIDKGAKVSILDEKPVNGFYKVSTVDGTTGFCMKEFISVR